MIASTGSFDAGPVDGYLADLAAALGRTEDERRHRAQLAELSRPRGVGVVALCCRVQTSARCDGAYGKEVVRAVDEGGDMTSASTDTAPSAGARRSIRGLVAARSIPEFSTKPFALGWPPLAMLAAGFASTAVDQASTCDATLGSALAVTWAADGRLRRSRRRRGAAA